MIDPDSNFRSELLELLAGNALGDLDVIELQKLDELLTDADKVDSEELHSAVGALQLAFASQDTMSMPSSLRAKIASDAPKYLTGMDSQSPVQGLVETRRSVGISRREQFAWFMTAASLLLAVGLWVWASNKQSGLSPMTSLTLAQARADLIAQASDRIEVAWSSGTTPFDAAVTGDVVWSNSLQKGFMRFVGMPINDRSLQQYQLWIIDPLRDEKPIDGGVFDVTSEGEVIVPIDAKLRVIAPAAFAVTIEKPGGVVVSDQKRLPLLASVPESRG